MTMRSYDDDEFRPWYIRDTRRYLQLSLEARGLVAELLRKWDHHGRMVLSADPVGDLAYLLRIDEDTTRRAFVELTEPSGAFPIPRLHWDPSTATLSDPDFAARDRRGKGAARTAKWRAQKEAAAAQAANGNDPSRDVTSVTSVTTITDRPQASLSGLVSSGLLGSDLDLPRSEDPPQPPREDRDFAVGTAAAEVAREAFATGVAAATGKPFALARAPFHDRDLCALLNTHAPPDAATKSDILRWLPGVVAAWYRTVEPATITPGKLLDWLNAGRQAPRHQAGKRGAGGGPRGDRQGLDGWTPPVRTGTDDIGGEK